MSHITPRATPPGLSWSGAYHSITYNGDYLTSVSCTSASFCAAVDSQGFAYNWNGTS